MSDKLHEVVLSDIVYDQEFNCRDEITKASLKSLMASIAQLGLQQPIVIQPHEGKYRILMGNRRYLAHKYLGKNTILSIINETAMSETEAKILNITENVQRQDLSILEESKAIRPFMQAGFTDDEVGKMLGTSRGWVQVRHMISTLPDDIQEMIGTGMFTQAQIRDLFTMRENPQNQEEFIKKIKRRKANGQSSGMRATKATAKGKQKRRRTPAEIKRLQFMIRAALGNCFSTVCLAWAAGYVEDDVAVNYLLEECENAGIDFTYDGSVDDYEDYSKEKCLEEYPSLQDKY